MKRITFLAAAANDIEEALSWYRKKSRLASVRFYAELQKRLSHGQERPQSFPTRVHSFRRANLHRFPYYVIYREQEDSIQVVALAHGSRRPGVWRERVPDL